MNSQWCQTHAPDLSDCHVLFAGLMFRIRDANRLIHEQYNIEYSSAFELIIYTMPPNHSERRSVTHAHEPGRNLSRHTSSRVNGLYIRNAMTPCFRSPTTRATLISANDQYAPRQTNKTNQAYTIICHWPELYSVPVSFAMFNFVLSLTLVLALSQSRCCFTDWTSMNEWLCTQRVYTACSCDPELDTRLHSISSKWRHFERLVYHQQQA